MICVAAGNTIGRFMVKKSGEARRRGTAIQVRVTEEEKRLLTEAAQKAGSGLSAWLRAVALKEARRLGVK